MSGSFNKGPTPCADDFGRRCKPVSAIIEPVCKVWKRKLENAEQRLARKIPRTGAQRTENVRAETRRVNLTVGNVGDSHTRGNQIAETALVGWGTRIRT